MLEQLRIRGLGVISDATLTPGPGLTVVTGETGAGKTMVVSGLELLTGSRADSGMVRKGSERALVEGRFTGCDEVTELVDEVGGEIEDGELLVSRQVTAAGRSRAFVGGVQTPVIKLAEITNELVVIHGQNEQVRLVSPSRQRQILDRFAGPKHLELLDQYRSAFQQWQQSKQLRDDLVSTSAERARQADLLRFGLGEIESVAPEPDEIEELSVEANRLQAIDDLRMLAEQISILLAGTEYDDQPGASGLIGQARKLAGQIGELDPTASELVELVNQASYLTDEAASRAASYLADLEADPARLEYLTSRLAELKKLTRKYGSTIFEVLQWAVEAAQTVTELDGGDSRIEELTSEIAVLEGQVSDLADQISQNRQQAAKLLATRVQTELAALAMRNARISFQLTKLENPTLEGQESVQIMFSANPGMALAPLSKVASGGELSRLRLALEVVIAEPGHIFVFDEVDAGIGGSVAIEVGRRLATLATYSQVLVVTHLAQVAAFADTHFVVEKSSDGEITSADLVSVSGSSRLVELARMMGGTDSQSAREHALEILKLARKA